MSPLMSSVVALEESVAVYLHSGAKDDSGVLASIFILNNLLGRLFREGGDVRLKPLQVRVNEATVAVKRGDGKGLSTAMERVREAALAFESPGPGR